MSSFAHGVAPLARILFRWLPLPKRLKARLKHVARHHLAPPRTVAEPGRRPQIRSGGRAIGWRGGRDLPAHQTYRATVVAFYLPQFHPIPENDTWWGKGFTEWTNVTRALPQFERHYQPRLPGELGFYDLRLPSIMQRQVELAQRYGVGAFCFYYYWFGGRRVLDGPVEHYLGEPTLTLPFCLCWANEPWTRRWDGREDDVLLAQQHSASDDLAFIASVTPYLRDPRYLRVEGRPILVLYRAELLPQPALTAARWRTYCREAGIGEIHLACVESFSRKDPTSFGFDSAIEFPPNLTRAAPPDPTVPVLNPEHNGEILDWRKMAGQFRHRKRPPYPLFRGVNCAWDNEARRPGRGRSFIHAAPRRYEDWLRAAIDDTTTQPGPPEGRLIFVNAWNEWAEGAHLEPDARLGHAWLEATRRANTPAVPPPSRPCIVVHAHYPELLDEILEKIAELGTPHRLVVTTSPQRAEEVAQRLSRSSESTELQIFENRGRDILPFLHVADELIDQGERIVLKLHTKRSPHLRDGDLWRGELLQCLLSPDDTRAIEKAFEDDPKLGLVGPSGHFLDAREHVGGNAAHLSYLMRQLGIETSRGEAFSFFAGSMFWARLEALRPLLDAHLDPSEFEPERGQRDGTTSHAIERLIPAVVQAAGYHLAGSSQPSIKLRVGAIGSYRFAPWARQ